MQLPLSTAIAPALEYLDETGSTNDVLRARAESDPEFSVVVTGSQTAGRGRLGRVWVAPPGRTLAASVLLKPTLPGGAVGADSFGWLPLLAGLAMTRAVDSLLSGHEVSLKWPNDVQVDGLKVSGILTEFVPPAAVIVGAGLNLELDADELPTPQATSLALNGATLRGERSARSRRGALRHDRPPGSGGTARRSRHLRNSGRHRRHGTAARAHEWGRAGCRGRRRDPPEV
jgi:BirA family biotin operon repressor/biotin-[acetyl-CoA-carboxylase] ligase